MLRCAKGLQKPVMPHFYCSPRNIKDKTVNLSEEESRHLTKVLRKQIGDVINVFDGLGNSYVVRIVGLDGSRIVGQILDSPSSADSEKTFRERACVHLYISLPKGRKIEEIIDTSAQLGVCELHPVITKRTLLPCGFDTAKKLERWRRISLASSKQSARRDIMKINPVISFNDALNSPHQRPDVHPHTNCQILRVFAPKFLCPSHQIQTIGVGVNLIAYEGEETTVRDAIKTANLPDYSRVNLFVGPEGGFAPEEIELAKNAGFLSVSLGKNILRVETAAAFFTSVILYETMKTPKLFS